RLSSCPASDRAPSERKFSPPAFGSSTADMTAFAVPAPPRPVVPVEGSSLLFPVRRIYCVGRNYAAHRAEMGGDDREPPFFFSKPADALVPPGQDVPYPPATANLHHEIELVVAIGESGAIFGHAAGVD